jgi:hypothetical protein
MAFALELFQRHMSCDSPPNRRHMQPDCTLDTRAWSSMSIMFPEQNVQAKYQPVDLSY